MLTRGGGGGGVVRVAGTVGANQAATKIMGDSTDLHCQAYYAYSAHKSGGLTQVRAPAPRAPCTRHKCSHIPSERPACVRVTFLRLRAQSHLRFGPEPIKAPYLIQSADYVACHAPNYLQKYDVLEHAKSGGTFVINTPADSAKRLEHVMPAAMRRQIATKKLNVYTIDAAKIAQSVVRGRATDGARALSVQHRVVAGRALCAVGLFVRRSWVGCFF